MPYNDAPTEIHMSIRNTGMYMYVPVCKSTYGYVLVHSVQCTSTFGSVDTVDKLEFSDQKGAKGKFCM